MKRKTKFIEFVKNLEGAQYQSSVIVKISNENDKLI